MGRNQIDQANHLKAIRKENGISIQELCGQTGIPFTTYQQYEVGKRVISPQNLTKLASFYRVDKAYLMGYTELRSQKDLIEASEFKLTPSESDVIKGYRNASAVTRNAIKVLLGIINVDEELGQF